MFLFKGQLGSGSTASHHVNLGQGHFKSACESTYGPPHINICGGISEHWMCSWLGRLRTSVAHGLAGQHRKYK